MAVTADREAGARLRQAGDALPHASIGTVPILWYNADDGAGWDAPAVPVRHGLFTELGGGMLDLVGVLEVLSERGYDGWLMVEQDRAMAPPSEAAAIGRRVLAAALGRLAREDGGGARQRTMRTVA